MVRLSERQSFRGQRVLLVGLGLHGGGVATARWLVKRGAIVRVTDLKSAAELAPSVAKLRGVRATFHLGGYRVADWRWARRIVVNPAIPPNTHPQLQAVKRRGVQIDNEASIFMREFTGTAIGVTGTRGKTTTALLLGAILKRVHRDTIVSGNVREVPMLAHLARTKPSTWAVLELSSYQLERLPVAGRPLKVAVMTNLKVDHVDRHGSMSAYAQTKYNIFREQTPNDVKMLNWNDPACRRAAKIGHGRVIWFGNKLPVKVGGVTVNGSWVMERKQNKVVKLFPLGEWKLPGAHNLENLLAATAVARSMNVPATIIVQSVKSFHGVPYRQQLIRTWRGHQFINDTASTSPDATLAAMAIYPRGVYIIGGTDKALQLGLWAREIARRNVPTVFLPGSATVKLQAALHRFRYHRPLVTTHSMTAAVRVALALSQPKQEIILSPGAASFGLFTHEFDRGDQFNSVVRKL
ncbi:MAG: UDP-N-acetylmuramoyl-L-alanine--D-glutamate ligase [Patescibacteria group bacterium]